jgi:hypothetical protein
MRDPSTAGPMASKPLGSGWPGAIRYDEVAPAKSKPYTSASNGHGNGYSTTHPYESKPSFDSYADETSRTGPSSYGGSNPSNTTTATTQHESAAFNANDPIMMHLLVETAVIDSQAFEILPFEHVEILKRDMSTLSHKISLVKRKLAMESKVRDAALSLSRLYASKDNKRNSGSNDGNKPGHRLRKSLLGGRSDNVLTKTEDELTTSTTRCDELEKELHVLEQQSSNIQNRLLQHGMGILGYSMHKGGAATVFAPAGSRLSDGSIYSHVNGGGAKSVISGIHDFDDRSLYRSTEHLDDLANAYASSERDRFSIARESVVDTRQRSNSKLDNLSRLAVQAELGKAQAQILATAEKRLGELNETVRQMVLKSDHGSTEPMREPPVVQTNGVAPQAGPSLDKHLDYLGTALSRLDSQRFSFIREQEAKDRAMGERLQKIGLKARNTVVKANPERYKDYRPPPTVTGSNFESHIIYFDGVVDTLSETQLLPPQPTPPEVDSQKMLLERYETVLTGLWDLINAGEEQSRKQKAMKKQAQSLSPGGMDEDSDASGDEIHIDQPFSLTAFSQKVQMIASSVASLTEQKDILWRQIKQQRELNEKADETQKQRDVQDEESRQQIEALTAEIEALHEEIGATSKTLLDTEMRLDESEQRALLAEEQLGDHQQSSMSAQRDLESASATFNKQLSEHRRQIDDHKQQIADHQQQLSDHKQQIHEYEQRLEQSALELDALVQEQDSHLSDKDTLQKRLDDKTTSHKALQDQLAQKDKLIDDMEGGIEAARREGATERSTLQRKLVNLETNNKKLQMDLDSIIATKNAIAANEKKLQDEMNGKLDQISSLEKDLKAMERKVVTLTTEVALTRAELDTAKGTRSQRAAEASKASKANEEQQQALRSELKETLSEFEHLTKQMIESEKERDAMEGLIDGLKDRVEALESELHEERVKSMGSRSSMETTAPASTSTSTTIMRDEFRKMMREQRTEHLKAIKVCVLFGRVQSLVAMY